MNIKKIFDKIALSASSKNLKVVSKAIKKHNVNNDGDVQKKMASLGDSLDTLQESVDALNKTL